ncbi:MAG: alpha-hydroxy-acid oxidizing protein [Cardiobacteriaceae bacterium]|nr:alpha-hydroxy-acid oxidizing protein [Cardiobacteriaceae bacterium]
MSIAKIDSVGSIEDLRRAAEKRLPKIFYDYADSGAGTESTYKANEAAFSQIKLRQKVGVNVEARKLSSQILGVESKLPVVLSPVGLLGMQHGDGEILAAQAAEEFGVPFTLSTMSICSIEEVKAKVKNPFWFQLYVMRDREFLARLLDRAEKAGCPTLVLTMDLPVMGVRPKDVNNGLAVPPRFSVCTAANLLRHYGWWRSIVETSRRSFGNLKGEIKNISDPRSLAAWTAEQFDPTVTWETVKQIRDKWKGKLIVKGIMNADDAEQAVNAGADGVLVSNHGGRQLDGTIASLAALPEVVKAVGDKTEVYLDGGVRTGVDILRAKALGAKAVFVGRAYTYGLGAYGKDGVTKALSILQTELDNALALCGKTDVNDVNTSIFYDGTYPTA